MRIAVVSDIHGNRTAFDAVLADLRQTAPDLILHAGDLAHGGASPAYIVDRIRDLGWPGVLGNTDEMLFRPESLGEFARSLPKLQAMFAAIEDMATWDREQLGQGRLAWLRQFPPQYSLDAFALVHASPESCWRAPGPEAGNSELESTFSQLNRPLIVYGHIHRPFIREIKLSQSLDQEPREDQFQQKASPKESARGLVLANSGSVSLSHDGDSRASYLLIETGCPQIRRVDYDVIEEIRSLKSSSMPHAGWIIRSLQTASPLTPWIPAELPAAS